MRISKSVTIDDVTEITRHVWDGMHIVAELNGSNEMFARYFRGHDLHFAHTNDDQFWYTFDGMNNVVDLIGLNGQSIANYRFDAFGNQLNEVSNIHNPFRYRGFGYYDSHSGLHYLRHRFYDPNLGRFITEDPIRCGTNWFIYAFNNPIMWDDPTGLSPLRPWEYLIPLRTFAETFGAEVEWIRNVQVSADMILGTANINFGGSTFHITAPVINDTMMVTLSMAGEVNKHFHWGLTESQRIFVATIAGEAIGQGELAWQVTANVVMNRVADSRWPATTPVGIIRQPNQFEAYGGNQYNLAMNYLNNRTGNDHLYENLIRTILPIYNRIVPDITGGATLFYSPDAQRRLGRRSPEFASSPQTVEIFMPGINTNDFRLFRYR